MDAIAYVTLSNTERLPHYFDVTVRIPKCRAVHWLDAGRTSLIAIRFDKVLYELRAYRLMGYKLKFQKVRKA